jgi:hypothetical protein
MPYPGFQAVGLAAFSRSIRVARFAHSCQACLALNWGNSYEDIAARFVRGFRVRGSARIRRSS